MLIIEFITEINDGSDNISIRYKENNNETTIWSRMTIDIKTLSILLYNFGLNSTINGICDCCCYSIIPFNYNGNILKLHCNGYSRWTKKNKPHMSLIPMF